LGEGAGSVELGYGPKEDISFLGKLQLVDVDGCYRVWSFSYLDYDLGG
jgi:hypothetical protein